MGFVKVVKNKAYFKRFQVKFRRRREGKTDYYARKRLVTQAKNKYHSPKYRLVARFTNTDVVAQIIYSKIEGDHVMAHAYGHELTKYGIPVGFSNFAAAYATGLLVARRLLHKIGLAEKYGGKEEADGEIYHVEQLGHGPRPFAANLDVGLARTTTGAKVFAVLKGAADGGLNVPHNEKRFPGYDDETEQFNPDILRQRIYGEHISNYMKILEEEDSEEFKARFSKYISTGVTAESLPELYKKAHAAIRSNPVHQKKAPKTGFEKKRWNLKKLTYHERKERVKQKIALHFKNKEKK